MALKEQRTHDGRVVAWAPQPGPQTLLLLSQVQDIFVGGARFGGKSDSLLGDWLAHRSRYGKDAHGIFFRRTYSPELEEVIKRTGEFFQVTGGKYNITTHTWTWADGSDLKLRNLDDDTMAANYQGHSFTWMAFDELPNWPNPAPIDKLLACLRSAAGVPCVRRSTGNPGGPGGSWVKQRYRLTKKGENAWPPMVPFKYKPLPEDEPGLELEAMYIPSRLEDNRLAMENDPEYANRIAASAGGNQALYRAWRWGDWDALIGKFFEDFKAEPPWVVPEVKMEAWWPRWLAIDWGYKHDACALWFATDEGTGTVYVYRELKVSKLEPQALAHAILRHSKAGWGTRANEVIYDDIERITMSPDAFGARTSERSIADEMNTVFVEFGFPQAERADNRRVHGWSLINQLIQQKKLVIHQSCKGVIANLESVVRDERPGKDPNDIMKVDGDDPIDTLRYGVATILVDARAPLEERIRRELDGKMCEDLTDRKYQWLEAAAKLSKEKEWGFSYGGKRLA